MKIKFLIVALLISFSGFSFSKDCSRERDNFQEGFEFFQNQHYLLAHQTFSQVRLFGDQSCELDFKASYFQSASLLLLQDLQAFEISFRTTEKRALNSAHHDQVRLLHAYAHDLKSLSGANPDLAKRWKLWLKKDQVKLSDLGSPELIQLHEQYIESSHTKKPWVAGVLSALIPGAGQVYIGAYQSAALAFIFNGLLLATTLEFSRKNMDFAAMTSGTLFSMTYLGNIVSATKGAEQVNRSKSAPYNESLRKNLLPELEF